MINAINISSRGNAIDTGGEWEAANVNGLSVYSPLRMIILGGSNSGSPASIRTMHHIDITSNGNTTEFGETSIRGTGAQVSNNVRGVFGGYNGTDWTHLNYITIASLGEVIEFGELTQRRSGTANGNTCSHTRGIFMGGRKSPTFYNTIDYVNMQSLGNAMDFGDTTGVDLEGAGNLAYTSGTTDCHGGLGGY
tara:strand:- start:34 stop:612 length:579 start_codon:yes stop_codon:yes gene_type:complete